MFGDMLLVHQDLVFPFGEQLRRWVMVALSAIFHANPGAPHDHFQMTAIAGHLRSFERFMSDRFLRFVISSFSGRFFHLKGFFRNFVTDGALRPAFILLGLPEMTEKTQIH